MEAAGLASLLHLAPATDRWMSGAAPGSGGQSPPVDVVADPCGEENVNILVEDTQRTSVCPSPGREGACQPHKGRRTERRGVARRHVRCR